MTFLALGIEESFDAVTVYAACTSRTSGREEGNGRTNRDELCRRDQGITGNNGRRVEKRTDVWRDEARRTRCKFIHGKRSEPERGCESSGRVQTRATDVRPRSRAIHERRAWMKTRLRRSGLCENVPACARVRCPPAKTCRDHLHTRTPTVCVYSPTPLPLPLSISSPRKE